MMPDSEAKAKVVALEAEVHRLQCAQADLIIEGLDAGDKKLVAQFVRKHGHQDIDLWAELIRQRDEAQAALAALESLPAARRDEGGERSVLPKPPCMVLARRPIKLHADWCVTDPLYPEMLRTVNFPYTYFNDWELAELIIVNHPRNDPEAIAIIQAAALAAKEAGGGNS